MINSIVKSIEDLIEIKKINSSVYVLNFNNKAVYELIDSIMSIFGDISKYSEIMNNILAENLLERIITEKFLNMYSKQDNLNENAVQLKHISEGGERLYSISRLETKEWGNGIIYSSLDTKTL